ncbi:MAG: AAA family ATPase [Pseudomonadota bacterium]
MVEKISILKNIGQFDNAVIGQPIELNKLSLIYAENGRGKTTLANILRSLSENNPTLVQERQRLKAIDSPHIAIQADGKSFTFQNGAWIVHIPNIAIFDDNFVAQNVCSGIEVDSEHRQNLHELIIGAQGVSLSKALQDEVVKIEDHNRSIREKEAAIPISVRGSLTVDAFCSLKPNPDLENSIQEMQRSLEAAKSSDAIKQRSDFKTVTLPSFDLEEISNLLQLDLPDLQKEAAIKVQQHLTKLGKKSEEWVGDGMDMIASISENGREICPFCTQDLKNSEIIIHYQGYFSKAYAALKKSIIDLGKKISSAHSVDIQTAFERSIQSLQQDIIFWQKFTDIPKVDIDTVEIARAWKAVREPVLTILRNKAASPLEKISLSAEILEVLSVYENHRQKIADLSQTLQDYYSRIASIKEQAEGANVAAINADLSNLKLIQVRYSSEVAPHCKSYQDEKEAKKITEKRRDKARQDLDSYRLTIFKTYEAAINSYLHQFIAGFRLHSMASQNTRGGTSCTYNVLINETSVPVSSESGPSFKNTLSAGDRNTLALAFFFASLDKDPSLTQKIVVIDDPMTSLDEHRSLATINEIIKLAGRVKQVIVLSHTKPFLCKLWDDAKKKIKNIPRSSLHIIRSGNSSVIELWDIERDRITEHDKRHELVSSYILAGPADPNKQSEVAVALRPMIEAFLRVSYPAYFPPGSMLGPFHEKCLNSLKNGSAILGQLDTNELKLLIEYANHFHHDSNPAYATEIINDQTLLDYCKRVISFTSRS